MDLIVGVRTSIGIGEETEETEEDDVEHRFLNDRPHVNLSDTFLTGTRHFRVIQSMRADRCSIGEDRMFLRREREAIDERTKEGEDQPRMNGDILHLDSNRNHRHRRNVRSLLDHRWASHRTVRRPRSCTRPRWNDQHASFDLFLTFIG
jgi:hypothetical protein